MRVHSDAFIFKDKKFAEDLFDHILLPWDQEKLRSHPIDKIFADSIHQLHGVSTSLAFIWLISTSVE